MTFKTSAWVYPWDLQDEGIARVLDRLKQSGINGINVTTIYHSGMFFLPHNPRRKIYFTEPGSLYFPPDKSWYGKIKIKPPVSHLASRKFWEELREETLKRSMELTSWTLALHNSKIGLDYPETNVVNAFGDLYPTALCAANEDVREFILMLVEDLAVNYRFDNIFIESLEFMPLRHGYHHEVIGVPVSPMVDFLMSLSFSPSLCTKAKEAGIDIDSVRVLVRDLCSRELKDPFQSQLQMGLAELEEFLEGEFSRYLSFREKLLSSLLREIRTVLDKNGKVNLWVCDFGPLYPLGPFRNGWQNGVNLKQWLPYIDAIHPTFYFADLGLFKQKVDEYFSLLGAMEHKVEIIPAVRSILPQVASKKDLSAMVRYLKPHSDGMSFYNYGFMAYETLDWIRQEL